MKLFEITLICTDKNLQKNITKKYENTEYKTSQNIESLKQNLYEHFINTHLNQLEQGHELTYHFKIKEIELKHSPITFEEV